MIVSQATTVYTNLESMHKFLGCVRKEMERGREREGGGREKERERGRGERDRESREEGRETERDDSESLDAYEWLNH